MKPPRLKTRNGGKGTLIEWKEHAMTEQASIPEQEQTPEKTSGGSSWVRVQLPKDESALESITAQEVVAAIKEAQQEWVKRTIGKGGTQTKPAGEE